jgi:hypothetical protein
VTAHPSMLRLDAFSLGADDAVAAAHLRECARCAAHVTRVQQTLPIPNWVRELGTSPRRRHGKWSWLYRWSIAFVLALTVGAVLLRAKPWKPDQSDRGMKGTPSVAVYVKRDGAVSLWDGRAPLQPGDAVQLKVAPRGYSRVAVSALQDGALTPLYEGPATGEALLPRSFTVDDAPGPEVLLIAFSRSPLTPAGQEAALAKLPRTEEVWATRLQFVKRGGER